MKNTVNPIQKSSRSKKIHSKLPFGETETCRKAGAGMFSSHFPKGVMQHNKSIKDYLYNKRSSKEVGERTSFFEAVASAKLSAGLQTFHLSMPIHKLKKLEMLFYEGDGSGYFYEVLFGHIKTYKLLSNGRRLVIEFFHKGDIVGMPCKSTYEFYAQALTRTDVRAYSNEQIQYLLEKSPSLSRHIIDIEQDCFSHAMNQMVLLGRKKPIEKVASFLMSQKSRPSSNHAQQRIVDLPMSRTDIADYLGLTQETVCRVLNAFRRRGLVEVRTPYELLVHNIEAIQDICDLED